MRSQLLQTATAGSQTQAKEMGITVLPMPFMIDGETYYEDITLTQEQFYRKLKDNSDISTSQPTPDSIMKMWDELLKEYDQIVHIPMSAGLSGSCATAMMLAGEDEYEGNVFRCGQPPDLRDPVPVCEGRADVGCNGNGRRADQEAS